MLRIFDIRSKEVINIANGERLGYIYDFEIDLDKGVIVGIIMPSSNKGFSLFTKPDDVLIKWDQIVKVGADTILVNFED